MWKTIKNIGLDLLGECTRGWLDKRLVIGPQGNVGLCRADGTNSVVGNLLVQELEGFVRDKAFQVNLAKVTGHQLTNLGAPCLRCSFFEATE